MITVQNLHKRFGKITAVEDVSFAAADGQITGLLGPNGAGKTTTFYMTVGLVAPDSGRVLLVDHDVTDDPMYVRARKVIGYLPQEPSIFRGLTVEQNLLAILETLPLSRAERKARLEELLAELSLTHLAKSMAYTLSGGERRGTEPLSYQWHNGAGLILNATNAAFSLNPALTNHEGNYFAVVSKPYGQVTSSVASLTVFIPASINSGPFSQIVAALDSATFQISASGYPALNYQWLFNGIDVPGATSRSLVITNVGTNHLGYYWVEAWNAYSSVTSAPAALLMSPSIRTPLWAARQCGGMRRR